MSVNLYNLVLEKGTYIQNTERVELDVEDADIRWTFWEDDEEHGDDNGTIACVETLAVVGDNLIVIWDDGQEGDFTDLDYVDEDGYNLAEYIIDEIEAWAEDAFEDIEDEDEDEEEGVLPYEKHYLSDAYDNLKEWMSKEDLIQHMFDYFSSEDLHDFAEHLLEELGLEVKDVM